VIETVDQGKIKSYQRARLRRNWAWRCSAAAQKRAYFFSAFKTEWKVQDPNLYGKPN